MSASTPSADLDMAVAVTDNAKTQKAAPATPPESLLVHARRAGLPAAHRRRLRRQGVEMRCEPRARALAAVPAPTWSTPPRPTGPNEYLAAVISVKVVDSPTRRSRTSTATARTTDAILTDSHSNAMRFLREVDRPA